MIPIGTNLTMRRHVGADGGVVQLRGVLDRSVQTTRISEGVHTAAVLDLEGVTGTDEAGIAQVRGALESMVATTEVALLRVRPNLLAALRRGGGLPTGASLVSAFVTFSCPTCQQLGEVLLDLRAERASQGGSAPRAACPRCGSACRPVQPIAEALASGLEGPSPVLSPKVTRLMELVLEHGPATAASHRAELEVRRLVSVLWLTGPLTERADLSKALEGATGALVVDARFVTFANPAGVGRLLDLLESAGPKSVLVEAPPALVRALARDARGVARPVASAWLPFACKASHRFEARAEAGELTAMRAGRPPSRDCAQCGTQARALLSRDLEAAASQLTLGRAPEAVRQFLDSRPTGPERQPSTTGAEAPRQVETLTAPELESTAAPATEDELHQNRGSLFGGSLEEVGEPHLPDPEPGAHLAMLQSVEVLASSEGEAPAEVASEMLAVADPSEEAEQAPAAEAEAESELLAVADPEEAAQPDGPEELLAVSDEPAEAEPAPESEMLAGPEPEPMMDPEPTLDAGVIPEHLRGDDPPEPEPEPAPVQVQPEMTLEEPAPLGAGPERFGSYEMMKFLGQGGMAEIMLARQVGPGGFVRQVALKRILPHHSRNPEFVEMFLREAQVAAKVAHPNVVQIFEFGQHRGQYFMAMEYVRGWDLHSVLKVLERMRERLPVELACRIVADLCAGLGAAHTFVDEDGRTAPIIHRDVSPHNVLISDRGVVKLADFGVAKDAAAESQTRMDTVKGKTAYLAPERITGTCDPLDVRPDLFAAGIVLYQCLSGEHPFLGDNDLATMRALLDAQPAPLRGRRREVPPALDFVVLKSLAKDPERRFQSAAELQSALDGVLATLPREASSTARVGTWLRELYQRAADAHHVAPEEALRTPSHVSRSGLNEVRDSTRVEPESDEATDPNIDVTKVLPRGR